MDTTKKRHTCQLCYREIKKIGMCITCNGVIRRKKELDKLFEERRILAHYWKQQEMNQWSEAFTHD